MNHPSEWAKFFDERAGRYRYKHKGSGVVRDTLMAIGKTLQMWQKKLYEAPLRKLAKNAAQNTNPQQNTSPETASSQPGSLVARCNDKTVSNFSEAALNIFSINIRNDVQNTPLC